MDRSVATRIARRFITLPLEKRRLYLQKMLEEGVSPANLPIPEVQSAYQHLPLSYAQERQWFLWQMDPDSSAYHVPMMLHLKGVLDIAALQNSFDVLINRHQSLRTTFCLIDEQPAQVIADQQVIHLDIQTLDADIVEREAAIEAFISQSSGKLFDLEHGPLLRVELLRIDAEEHVLVMTQHHIVSDGASMQVMVNELVECYAAFSQGRQPELPELPIQYADYAIWQRHWMEAGERERQLAYWTAQLGGEQPVLALPADRPRPAEQSYQGAQFTVETDQLLGAALLQMAQQHNVTPFMLLLASFQTLLHRYSQQNDIRIGVPSANRNRPETERLIGFFVNTQVLKAAFNEHIRFSEVLQQVRQAALDAQAHQDLPFEQLVSALQPERSLSHSPLFQVLFNHQGTIEGRSAHSLPQLSVDHLPWNTPSAQFDLTLNTSLSEQAFSASISYATDLFDAASIEQLSRHWLALLRAVVIDAEQPVAHLPLLDARERSQIVDGWNTPVSHNPNPLTVISLFEQQVHSHPEAVALIVGEQQLTYQQLNGRANQLAHALIERGVGPEVLVGVAVERSVDMIVALLGILKAGGAYLPLDPGYPEDRLAYMIDDSGIELLLTQAAVQSRLPIPAGVEALTLDAQTHWLERWAETNPVIATTAEHLAYTIYTSGSTGKPKGVMVAHGALVNFISSMSRAPGLGADDRLLSLTTFCFDIFGLEIYLPLSVGARLILAETGVNLDPAALLDLIARQGISALQATPSTWRMLLDHPQRNGLQGCKLLCGGEALSDELASRMLAISDQLWNLYGPTETTIWSAIHRLDRQHPKPWLGRAIDNTTFYILDADLQPAPLGVAGELLIGGNGLARGYLQRPDLSAERFVPDPFGPPGARLYRTGDRCRYRRDGIIEYLGRLDHQVKIRGFRIEPGEIESRLHAQPLIRAAAVLVQPAASGEQLVAYIVLVVPVGDAAGQTALREQIRSALRKDLPDYMVPAQLIFLDQLPLTPNGKLDRKALPLPDASQSQGIYVAPQTDVQRRIATIWQDVLKLEQVGISANFFDLGGDSIISIQLVSRARQQGIEFSPKDLFQHQTIEQLASVARITTPETDKQPAQDDQAFALSGLTTPQLAALPVPLALIEDIYPLSPMQQGMLFYTLEANEAALYLNQMAVSVEGLNVERFLAAWNATIQRHEILRTGFWSASHLAEPLQLVYKQAAIAVRQLDWQGRSVQAEDLHNQVAHDAAQGFDLLHAPLMRLTLIRLAENSHYLIWTSHHILMDGWSSSQLLGEVLEHYSGQPAPSKKGRYRDYIGWLKAQSQPRLERFWKDQLREVNGPTLLASAIAPRPDPGLTGHEPLYLRWDAEQTTLLREQAQKLRVTPNTLIQAAWLLLLQRFTGQQTVCFGATVAGRPASLDNADEMLGLFINTLPVVQSPHPTERVCDWLAQLQSCNLSIRDHEHASLADIQRWSGHSGQALFDSIIVFENHPLDERLEQTSRHDLHFGEVKAHGVTDFAMDLAVMLNDTLSIEFMVLRNQFTAEATEQIRRSYEALLLALLSNPQSTLGSLDMLSVDERLVLQESNRMAEPPQSAPLLAEVIEQHASQRPAAIAVSCAGVTLTYAELERRANHLAQYLISQGIGPENFVGVALERSVEVVVAFYAVMKTGAAYVPLDIDYPKERIEWIVGDSAMNVLLTQESLLERFASTGVPLVALDGLPVGAVLARDKGTEDIRSIASNLIVGLPPRPSTAPTGLHRTLTIHPENLAYLIYTSGSTGQPKGVAVSHEQIRMHCLAIAQRYEMDADTRELLFMSFAFDGAQERWLSSLLSGGCLVVRDNRLWTPEETWHALHAERISIACFPPAYLQQLAEYADSQTQAPPPVRIYCFGGDAVAEANFERVKRALRPQFLTNGYGPTETVVTPLLWKVDAQAHCGAVYAPIGTRVGERTLYVLDEMLNPLPIGVAGELYIGGQGVARGYHQRAALTAERFVADPFDTHGGRLYRTGDRVRQRADGVIDYLGRLDNQVKIRGFRIELGEIESRLRAMSGVQDAVVVARETVNGKQLIGYVVARGGDGFGSALRSELQRDLPDYMVPAQILVLSEFPLNANGKLDRNALPEPEFKGREFIAPRNGLERALAAIWQEVLQVEQVGVTDNFFELGGDSLRILKVLSKVRASDDLNIELKLRDMISKPTIAELSGFAIQDLQNLDPLLLLNSRSIAAPPLFCLHAGFGTVFDYEPVARCFEGQRSVYGLQCRMLLDRDWEDESLAAMAIDYAQYIRQKQADGPYHLLGWSLGGTLAVLVAQELESQGQQVDFLGLVDSFMPGSGPDTEQAVEQEDWSDDLRSFLAVIFALPVEQLAPLTLSANQPVDELEALIEQIKIQLPTVSAYASIGSDELAHTFCVAMHLKRLSRQINALPRTSSAAHCWWAASASYPTVPGAATNIRIPAGHYQMLNHPLLLTHLAQLLRDVEAVPQ
ncbi:non-ribosomal peptide synthetase [Pseudomonas syringae]|uniref:non-ribosomal peptide synthetase n=1 Tax=Pseudomonas syringae TaxID=317 RepID=UPI00067C8233|nr:non-ribosomal peptide synthetase [Pseudomonas syringae]